RDSVDLKSPHEINPVLSPQISEVVLRALALEPIARYQSVEEMQDAIHAPPFTEIYVPLQPKIEPAPIKLPVQPDSSRADAQNRKTKSGIAIGIVALIAVIALVCAILILPRVFAPAVVIAPTATQIAIAPTATREVPTSPPITTVAPTITRTLTPLPTATRTASPLPTNTPIPAPQLAPGVYVTNIRTLPPNPRNVDAISFVVTFFNNAGPLRFKWCVYLFPRGQPNTIGQTSCDATIDFPLGTYEYTSLSTWRLGTGTSCVDLNARVQGIETDGKKLFFKTPQGSENIYFLTVCP
ncbi:MAG: hypothetical protein HY070_03680, partial [Chloroflexi bacterium]|nr:hypothetical protein [Chloroflexota bacterium]